MNRSREAVALRYLRKVGDLSLAGIIILIPLTMAGIRDTGTALLILLSLVFGLTWAVTELLQPHSATPFSGAEIIIAAAVMLIVLQLIPLPPDVLNTLGTFRSQFLPMWNAPDSPFCDGSGWKTISLTPELTRSGLSLLLAYAVFVITLLHRIRSTDDLDHTMTLVAYSAALMAIIGLAQMFFGNGLFLWTFRHPGRSTNWPVVGTFSNQNHFAHFLALGAGPLLWTWRQSFREQGPNIRASTVTSGFGISSSYGNRPRILVGLIAVLIFAGVLTISRGGICSLIIAFVVSLSALTKDRSRLWRLSVPVALFVVSGFAVFGTEALEKRWHTIVGAESTADLSRGRFDLWEALAKAIPEFASTGAGLGSHAEVYPTWLTQHYEVRFSHAESGYL
ncbi:MAG: O-antigen ligase family protein, partial [Planctomycetaceae bacterium]|nr:O-antigen ligase family protein [Planctomycetaceae bacterium]